MIESNSLAYYVEIPDHCLPGLQFPPICPFTMSPNPKRVWELEGKTPESFVGVPGLTFLMISNRVMVFRIPVSVRFLRRQYFLALLAAALVFPFLGLFVIARLMVWFGEARDWLLIPPFAGVAVYAWKVWQKRNVNLAYVGKRSLELRFLRRKYAKDFAALNGLTVKWKLLNFHWD